ncbi:MAG: tubulin-like doman-containing protein [Chloroflexota bacterium]
MNKILEEQLEVMRPTLITGAGGSGQMVLTDIKAILTNRLGQVWRRKIYLLAFDTAEEPFAVQVGSQIVRLEPGSEFFNVGNVPIPSIKLNLDGLKTIQERLGPIMSNLPPVVLRSGAKQLRPLGLLAFLWNYATVSRELKKAIWRLAGRDQQASALSSQQQGINVFICGSLVGGTGSGAFLDLAYLIRAFFAELGSQGEFCHVTGVGLLPQAFHGINGPNLRPNTSAALEELNHAMLKGDFQARYPDGFTIKQTEAPFNLYYVVDGVDERGQAWSGLSEVTAMTAEAIYLQMGSQLGRKGENAFDNLDEVLVGRTPDGDGTFLGSFGLGVIEFPAPAVASVCAGQALQQVISQSWLRPAAAVSEMVMGRLQPLEAAPLTTALRHDPTTGGEMQIDLHLPDWLLRLRPGQVPTEATRYVREYGHARVNETYLPQMDSNATTIATGQSQAWQSWVNTHLFNHETGVLAMANTLAEAQARLSAWSAAARRKLAEFNVQQERQAVEVGQLESSVAQAADSFMVGRAGRLREALTRYFQAAQTLYEWQLEQRLWQAHLKVWGEVELALNQLYQAVQTLCERLAAISGRLGASIPKQLRDLAASGVARISLADEAYVQKLYQRYAPAAADVTAAILFDAPADSQVPAGALHLCTLASEALEEYLWQRLRRAFHPIEAMTVEEVIRERSEQMSPQARRQQLFRLATPSWNLDRARLPEGGAGLVRLEVLGVSDETDTLFTGEPMLVSTHDPHRLMALVVVVGAPRSALQQYPVYQQTLAQVRGQRPFYVLPNFLSDASEAKKQFALGLLFGLLYNQGAFFYYRPADPLASPILLANGLANAIEAFATQDGLVNSVNERISGQIAQIGIRQAINLLSEYYSKVPDGSTPVDELTRELKRLVRDYADELRQIEQMTR